VVGCDVLTRPGNLDEPTVQVEAHESVAAADRASLGDHLRNQVQARVGVSVTVEVMAAGALDRSLGKAKRISDRRPGLRG